MKATLKEVRTETASASTFIFTPELPLNHKPGQHLTMLLVHANPDNRGITRPFTISSSPTESGIVTITTKRGSSSFKQALFALGVGATVEIRGPAGNLILLEDDPRPHLILAGGIGITPFRSMLKYAFDKQLTLPITLLYSNKVPEEIVFRHELAEFSQKSPHLKIIETITRPEETNELWTGRTGRIDAAMIQEFAQNLTNTNCYTAGPPEMVDGIVALLGSLGVAEANIQTERFAGY